MLSKIYYAIGASILLVYSGVNLYSIFKPPPPIVPPQAKSFKTLKMTKGKYVYVPPRTRSYPGSRSGSGYPRSGGYSGGK